MIKRFYVALMAIGIIACKDPKQASVTPSAEETEAVSMRLHTFLDSVFDDYLTRDPNRQSYLGIKTNYDKWTDLTDEHTFRESGIAMRNLEVMKTLFDFQSLNKQAQLSYQMYEYQTLLQKENEKWIYHTYPINPLDGIHSNIPSFLINVHQVKNENDASAYIARLTGINQLFDQLISALKIREEKNIIPPKFTFPMVIDDCKNILKGAPFENTSEASTLLDDFSQKVNALTDMDDAKKKELISKAKEALSTAVKPAYEKLIAYLETLEKKATEDDGAWKFPEGDSFYAQALKNTTTTHLTADEIHEIGLKEVTRIHGEMKELMKKVNFKNDNLQDFFKFMRTDKQFYYPNDSNGKKTYMKEAMLVINNMKAKLDELFLTKPKADMIVKPVEPFREKSAAGAFYEEPALDGSRPGTYYINLYNMADQAKYQIEALAYHEGIPGHHMQIAIAQELKGIPKFRTLGGNTAYVEGWALYSEQLGKEVGFYTDPYSDFGRLSMELFRAARLVVDTGIHKKKWSRKKALAWFNENNANPEGDNKKEIDRYVVWPGQATGYKIGMLKIMELREHARQKLGDKFNLREFHDVLLINGAVPLNILEGLVDEWVKKKSGNV